MISEKPSGRPCGANDACPADQHCEAGICVAGVIDGGTDPCENVTCNPGETCEPATGNCVPDGTDGGVTLTPCDPGQTDMTALHGTCGCADSESVRCRAGGDDPLGGECLCIRLMGHLGGMKRTAPLGIREKRIMESRIGAGCAPVAGSGIQVCGGITQ
ncbi:MAG: hypothetical protein P1V51_14460 [Deltaproteobacteria bacterium]|nr:hypothetical protein [Deltaproteobacteria bacterium]